MKKLAVFIIFLLLSSSENLSFGETIQLKSGKVIEGNIVQLTAEDIKVDIGVGVTVTYFRDEIENIDGNPIPSKREIEIKGNEKLVELNEYIKGEKKYYDTGELMSEGSMIDGDFRSYYKNGQVALEGNFKDSQPWDGLYRKYREDGSIEIERVYKEGVLLDKDGQTYNGVVKMYFENGNILDECPYKNGKRDGTSRTYHKNGKIAVEIEWKDGKQNGYYKAYDEKGALAVKMKFKNDQMVLEE